MERVHMYLTCVDVENEYLVITISNEESSVFVKQKLLNETQIKFILTILHFVIKVFMNALILYFQQGFVLVRLSYLVDK